MTIKNSYVALGMLRKVLAERIELINALKEIYPLARIGAETLERRVASANIVDMQLALESAEALLQKYETT
jgi:hypothetical protein